MASERASLIYLLVAGAAEAMSSERALSSSESAHLENVVRRLKTKRSVWHWDEQDDLVLKCFIQRRAYLPKLKPFQPNDEVRLLAQSLNRSYETTHKRLQLLRKTMNFPNAGKRRKA